MAEFRYGPVELYLVGFEGDRPDPGVIAALNKQVSGGHVRLLDFVLVSKSEDGEVTIIEVDDDEEEYGLDLVVDAVGITGEEDIADLADVVPPGGSALVVALELVYQRALAESVVASGGVLLSYERIPAPVVNAIADAAESEGEQE
ncbi:DUF6325 family protein [Microbacterium terricola]|uniref:DUF1269 domain-containing protein n=1 Tax=Microbacterium terricola TaxID=344163 RepID=A0ABM8E2J3_9MICO|nr:DUF6325 family protein [Microbacterium terricola]UYK40110.1 DUF6325 family protein [Microbacterium terricola]BDV32188.1 hypothetical protein Microterr_28480 [Microbacterium terricola]